VLAFLSIWWYNAWTLIPLSVMYSCMHLLLIPGGLASAGMTCVTTDLARERHSFGLSDFADTVKRVWKQALCMGLINLLITAFLLFVGFLCKKVAILCGTQNAGWQITIALILLFVGNICYLCYIHSSELLIREFKC
jgi:hypothetical protein